MFWFFRAPGWFRPFLVTGCILMLPIVGQIVLYGWYLAARDNLRAGWQVLPRPGFEYLERGARPWLAALVYALYALPGFVLLVTGLVVAIVDRSGVAIAVLAILLVLYWAAWTLLFGFLNAALFDVADTHGIGAAIHPGRLWAAARADSRSSWRVFLALFLGGLIYLGITVVTLPLLIFIPFGSLLLNCLVPAVYLMAAPAQAEFHGPPTATPG
jgi:hypothetical protein